MNLIAKNLKRIGIFLIVAFFIYFGISLIILNLDITKWSQDIRAICVVLSILIGGFVVAVTED